MLELLTSLPTVCALLLSLCFTQACSDEWYGDDCEFQCHCEDPCDISDDTCDQCSSGFFGPGCQFYDAVYWDGARTNPPFIRNRSISSCNPRRLAHSLIISLVLEIRFTWLRIVVNNASALHHFQLKLNGISNSCVKRRHYNISATTLDVSCDTTDLVKFLTIEGDIVPHICMVQMNAGRNVALKKQVTLSPSSHHTPPPDAAVDAVINPDPNAQLCPGTDAGNGRGELNVTLPHPAVLYRVIIYSSDMDPEILGGFIVSTYSENDSFIESVHSPATQDARYSPYQVVLRSNEGIKNVSIQGGYGYALTLCEVLVFGEEVCPDRLYGMACNKKCNCFGHEICNPVTGLCAPGCPTGFYGFQCSQPCDPSCKKDPCLQVSGRCYRCPEGFKGEGCNEECSTGRFGASCERKCPDHCLGDCDPIDGFCECFPGYTRPLCRVCPEGQFGNKCSQNCSNYCLNGTCHHVTGYCNACVSTRIGPYCEDCPEGKHGEDCSKNCSQFCTGNRCHDLTGACFQCDGKHSGEFCTECPASFYGYSCNASCPANCESGRCHPETGLCVSCASDYYGPTCSRTLGLKSKLVYFSPIFLLLAIPFIVLLLRKREHETYRISTGAVSKESGDEEEDSGEDHHRQNRNP